MSTTYGLQVVSEYTVGEYAPVVIVVAEGEKKVVDRAGVPGLLAIRVSKGAELQYIENIRAEGFYHTYIYIEGEDSSVQISSTVATSSGGVDISHKVFHSSSRTTSQIQTRGVISGNAQVIYTSEIRAEHTHQSVSGIERADFLVLDSAKVSGIPALSIATDSVVCSHSFSVTPMQEGKLAYLLSKGYTCEDARQTIIDSFLEIC
jgi:Fe-S cluster assembly scaffold protein SufB